MKGFFIDITNNLLEPKHRKAMGETVWEFKWCLDHITKIDEDGKGWVLGSKPIKLNDIKADLGLSRQWISHNLNLLEANGYLCLTQTGRGIIIQVNKAQKRFQGKKESGLNISRKQVSTIVESRFQENTTSNKTRQLDKTKNTLRTDSSQLSSEQQRELVDYLVIKKKMPYNPDKPPSSALTPVYVKQAKAIKLILKAGYSIEDIKWGIDQLAKDDFYLAKFDLMTVYKRLPFLKSEEKIKKEKDAWQYA